MSIVNILGAGSFETKENVVQQILNHNKDTTAHQGMSFPANGGNSDTVDGKYAADLQNYNNLINKPTSLPANGENADTVDGKHAADLQNYNNLTNKPTSMKNPYSLTVQFNGTSQKIYDGSATHTLNITPSGIGAAAGSHTHSYSSLTNIPTSLPANGGNADTVDGKHASNFVTDSPTEANKYTTVLSWALAQNQSGVAYSSADSSLSNAEDKPSNGQYGQFHYLLLKGENTRKTVLAFEYELTGESIYRRCIFNSSWIDSWIKISDNGNADTVDNYHAYQFQNIGSDGNPEGTYLKSQYDGSKGKFYIKAYDKDSGNYLTGVYVDYAANSDMLQDKRASDFYSVHTVPIDRTTNPITWDNGIYTVERDIKKSDGYPFDSGWVHATIYVSGQRSTDLNTGERRGYGVIRYLDNANNEFIKTQMWGENQWSEWRRIITDDVLSYKETEPNYIGGGYTVMLKE